MSLKQQLPIKDGWLHMKLTLTKADPIEHEELKQICTWGNADKYEFGHLSQNGKRVVAVVRELKPANG